MASKIVQITDFQNGAYKIPGSVSVNSGEGVNADLQAFIELREVEILYRALGKTQGDEFYTALDDIGAAATHWQQLLSGQGEYVGIKELVQAYVFAEWLRKTEISLTSSGAAFTKVKNTVLASMASLYVDAWNRFVNLYQDLHSSGYKQESLEEFIDRTSEISGDYFVRVELANSFGL